MISNLAVLCYWKLGFPQRLYKTIRQIFNFNFIICAFPIRLHWFIETDRITCGFPLSSFLKMQSHIAIAIHFSVFFRKLKTLFRFLQKTKKSAFSYRLFALSDLDRIDFTSLNHPQSSALKTTKRNSSLYSKKEASSFFGTRLNFNLFVVYS